MAKGHLHMEPGGAVNSIERVGRATVQIAGALHTAYQVGKGLAYAARYVSPILGML